VTNVSVHGFWLLLESRELFVSFSQFPWFRDASIGHLVNVELPTDHHLHWPDLDVDLEVESIEHPELYPLVSRERPQGCADTATEFACGSGGTRSGVPQRAARSGRTPSPSKPSTKS